MEIWLKFTKSTTHIIDIIKVVYSQDVGFICIYPLRDTRVVLEVENAQDQFKYSFCEHKMLDRQC